MDLFLPNKAFHRRTQGRARGSRLKYWAIRTAIAVLALLIIILFKIQQHPQLH